MKTLQWHGQALSVAVRRLRDTCSVGEFAGLVRVSPPQIDTVVFRAQGTVYVGFGGGLPALAVGDPVTWAGQAGEILLFANAADTVTELTERASRSPDATVGRGLARVAHALHIDRVLDRLGVPELMLVISDWGPFEAATEPLADAAQDPGTPTEVR